MIGIGAGPATDGQVLVFHDLLGSTTDALRVLPSAMRSAGRHDRGRRRVRRRGPRRSFPGPSTPTRSTRRARRAADPARRARAPPPATSGFESPPDAPSWVHRPNRLEQGKQSRRPPGPAAGRRDDPISFKLGGASRAVPEQAGLGEARRETSGKGRKAIQGRAIRSSSISSIRPGRTFCGLPSCSSSCWRPTLTRARRGAQRLGAGVGHALRRRRELEPRRQMVESEEVSSDGLTWTFSFGRDSPSTTARRCLPRTWWRASPLGGARPDGADAQGDRAGIERAVTTGLSNGCSSSHIRRCCWRSARTMRRSPS